MLPVLPDDVLVHMFQFFDTTSDAFTGCQVSKHWFTLLRERCPWLWRTMRVQVTHGVVWDTAMMTRSKRKRTTILIQPLFAAFGASLHSLTLGMTQDWCELELNDAHLVNIATNCPALRKLKLFVTGASPRLHMSAINELVLCCPHLTNLALPVTAAAVIQDELPVKYMSISKLRLHGTVLPRHQPVWLSSSIVTLKLVSVTDVDLDVLKHCTNLKHLIIHNCTSSLSHPVHFPEDMEDEGSWVYQLACRLQTLGVVRSSTFLCNASLLTSLALYAAFTGPGDEPVPWRNLRDLWLDAQIFPGDLYETERLFSCLSCTRYFIYKRCTATEVLRCDDCRREKFLRLEAVYLVN